MIRMYGREWSQRAIDDGCRSLVLMILAGAAMFTAVAAGLLAGILAIRGVARILHGIRMRRRVAYVDLTVVSTENLPIERRPPPQEYVN